MTNCFTYLIGWSQINRYYYGARWANNCDPSDLWTKYFTSSKQVKIYRKIFGEPDIIEIRKTFGENKLKVAKWEQKFLKRFNVKDDIRFLNITNSNNLYHDNSGYLTIKFEGFEKYVHIKKEDLKYINLKYTFVLNGKVFIRDKDNNIVLIPKELYDKNIHNHTNKNKVSVIDKNGSTFRVDKDDIRFKTDEIWSVNKNTNQVFDEDNNLIRVDKNHPKLLDGTYKQRFKDTVIIKDGDKFRRISIYDQNYIDGKYKTLNSGGINVKNKDNHRIKIYSKEDPRWLSGEYVSVNRKMVFAKDSNDIEYWVHREDIRIINGELKYDRPG